MRAINPKNIIFTLINNGPVIFLYFLSISEIDTYFSSFFEILSFNLQLIIVYYWMLRGSTIVSNGHIFFAGIINDVVMGLPMGISSFSYLMISFVASYVKNLTVNISLFTDWSTFLVGVFISNLTFLILIYNFSDISLTYTSIFYNSFFTILFYPAFWVIFNLYKTIMTAQR